MPNLLIVILLVLAPTVPVQHADVQSSDATDSDRCTVLDRFPMD